MCLSSGWHSESLRTRWKAMKTLSLWNEISLASWVLKDYHDATGFCKWHVSHQGDANWQWSGFLIQTTQRKRVACLHSLRGWGVYTQRFPACWKTCSLISCESKATFYCLLFCVIAGGTELCQLDEFCSWIMTKASISGEVLQPGPSHRRLQDEGSVSVLWQSSPWFPLSPLLPALLMDTIPGRRAQKCSAIPLFLVYLYKEKYNSGWNEKHTYIRAYTHTHTLQINAQHINRTYYKLVGEEVIFIFFFVLFWILQSFNNNFSLRNQIGPFLSYTRPSHHGIVIHPGPMTSESEA